jgi:DNA-directed RNA polymerase II subunit RPB11
MSSLEAKFKREFSFRDVEGVAGEDPYGAGTGAGTGTVGWEGRDYLDF